jgi:hypothetical protein
VLLAVVPAGALLIGCSGKEDFDKPRNRDRKEKTDDKGDDGSTETTVTLKPIQGKGVASLRGVVKLEGAEPDFEALTDSLQAQMKKVPDAAKCLMGSTAAKSQYSWIVDGKTRGVNNVFVWMRPADDKKEFFDVQPLVKDHKGWDKEKVIDQPHCAFEPHALLLFPRYVDPAKPSTSWRSAPPAGPPETGQVLRIINTGTLNHNANPQSTNPLRMQGVSGSAIPPMGELKITRIQPDYKTPVTVTCSVHQWMKSYIWAFEHPFASITGSKQGEKTLGPGEFLIENIPAGVPIRVVAWHEEGNFLNGGEKGETITLKEGENTQNFTIKAK